MFKENPPELLKNDSEWRKIEKKTSEIFLDVFLLYESSSGNQVDGLPLALVGRSEGQRQSI